MTTENLTVRQLLDLLGDRIVSEANALYVAMNDADNDGNKGDADWLEAQHNVLVEARSHISDAIEKLTDYDDLRNGESHESLSTSITRILGEGGYDVDLGDGYINISVKGAYTNIEFNTQFSKETETWQSFEYVYLTGSYDLGNGEQTIDLEIGGEHDAYDLLAIAKNIFEQCA